MRSPVFVKARTVGEIVSSSGAKNTKSVFGEKQSEHRIQGWLTLSYQLKGTFLFQLNAFTWLSLIRQRINEKISKPPDLIPLP